MSLVDLAATKNIRVFLERYKITNDQGDKLDFRDHGFLEDIYEDFSPKQVILKAAQVGFSTMANIKALWMAKNKKVDIIYTLPSASDIKDFVSGKTNRLIDNNKIFQEWTADKDSIEQKRVGDNVIYFKGTWTERAALATPADVYISDETDRSKQEIVQQYKTRLQHSKFGYEWYFSNPSAVGHGVSQYWDESDQKHWFIKCSHCGEMQYMTMDNISGNPPRFVCIKCGKEIDRRKGTWVPKWQDQKFSGYWISLLMAPWVSAEKIMELKNKYTEEQFSNFVLGLPYSGKGNVLSYQAFMQNITSTVNPQKDTPIIGVDTGIGINYVVGNERGLFYYAKDNDYSGIESLLKRWPNAIAVIDQGGDIIGPRKLREKYKGRVFLCYFGSDRKNDSLVKWDMDDGTVIADRNKLIQLVVDEFTEKRVPVSGREDEWMDYWMEWRGMHREIEESETAAPKYVWHKPSTGRCDYPFATVYWRIGVDKFGSSIKGKFISPSGQNNWAFQGIDSATPISKFLPKYRLG